MPSATIPTIQVLSLSIALVAAGGIATLSLFDVPSLLSQPASRSLPSTRWLFSRGSHIFPLASQISTLGFSYLAYKALPPGLLSQVLNSSLLRRAGFVGYLGAALLTFSIAVWTPLVMIPTNFKLIKMNEERGGARSTASARAADSKAGRRSADDSVAGKGEAAEFSDLSGPQETIDETSESENEQVRELLATFGWMNGVRAALMGLGGVVGLVTALVL